MARIASSVAHFKRDPGTLLPDSLILDACGDAGHAWRDRLLGPVILLRLMVWQMLLGNVSCRRLKRVAGFTAGGRA